MEKLKIIEDKLKKWILLIIIWLILWGLIYTIPRLGKICTPHGAYDDVIPVVAAKNIRYLNHIKEYGMEETAVNISPYYSDEQRYILMRDIKELADEICTEAHTDEEKLICIARWTARNISYDKDSAKNGIDEYTTSLENIFKNGYKTTCAGYANVISALCACQGIYCVNLRGGSASGDSAEQLEKAPRNHEWCGAFINGEWHFIDATWASDRYYENGKYGTEVFRQNFYCDMDFNEMSVEHRIDSAVHWSFDVFLNEGYRKEIQ